MKKKGIASAQNIIGSLIIDTLMLAPIALANASTQSTAQSKMPI